MADIEELFPEVKQKSGIDELFPEKAEQTPSESSLPANFEDIPEIGEAPELNALSMPAFRSSFGLLAAGDDKAAQAVIQQQFPESTFEQFDGFTLANLPSGQYVLNKPGISGQDIARFLFGAAAFTPAGAARTIAGAAVGSAATELAIQAAGREVGTGEIDAEDVALSGLLGGAFKMSEDLIGAGYRALRGSKGEGGEIGESAAREGIPTMTSDVSPPATFAGRMMAQTGEKVPIVGTGGMREAQQQSRVAAVERIAEKYSSFSYPAIVKSLKENTSRIKRAAGSVLEKTGQTLDEVGEVPLTNTRQAIENATENLNRRGVIRPGGALDDLDTLMKAINEAPQTFTSLKENRTAFRDIVNGLDSAERSQLGTRAKGQLQGVLKAMSDDMDDIAKNNLSAKEYNSWKKANSVWGEEASKLTKTRIKNVLDKGDVTPENAQTMIFSQKPSEVKSFYQALTPEGRRNARAAIIDKVITDISKRNAGVTPNSFASEMKKYGLQVDVFFKGEEKKQLDGLLKVLNATRRAQDAPVTTPTGQVTLGAGTGLAAFIDPLSTAATATTLGGLARLYESAPVRSALLRLSNTPKGSTAFEAALSDVRTVLASAAQSESRIDEE